MAYFDSPSSLETDFDDLSNDKDFLIALQLQNQFDKEEKENDHQLDKITQVTYIFRKFCLKILISLDSSNEWCR
jgi:hypothetical protein